MIKSKYEERFVDNCGRKTLEQVEILESFSWIGLPVREDDLVMTSFRDGDRAFSALGIFK